MLSLCLCDFILLSFFLFFFLDGFLSTFLVLIYRHGGKHVGEAINKLAEVAKKQLKKTKPIEIVQPSKPTVQQKKDYNASILAYHSDVKSYESALVELKVLSTNKAFHYFKKSWKLALEVADGEMEKAKKLIKNIGTHLDGSKPCVDCEWHETGDDYVQSFGPFTTTAAMTVINLWIEKYTDEKTLAKYISFKTTNYNEYVNSLEGVFNPKTKHLCDLSYDACALYTSALANVGPVVDQLVVQELGLPWEAMQQHLLDRRITAHEYNSERKQSESYKATRSKLKQKRVEDTDQGRKCQSYKSVEVAKENDKSYKRAMNEKLPLLFPIDNTSTKRRKTGSFVPGDFVFVVFGSKWFYGVVLKRFEGQSEMYFIDEDTKSVPDFELKARSHMKPQFPVWVPVDLRPNNSKKETIDFSDFETHIDMFSQKLKDYFEMWNAKMAQ